MSAPETTSTDEESNTIGLLRRRIVQVFGGIGLVSFAGAMLAPLKNLGIAQGAAGESLSGQALVLARRYSPDDGETTYEVGETVTGDMFATPDSALVYPENHVGESNYIIRLHRLPPDEIGGATIESMTADGHVAYSAICTHLGCEVEWNVVEETPTGKPTDYCNCHGSQFDPYQGAEVVHPPANRALPQIGVSFTEEDALALSSDFEEEIGP